LFVKIKRFNLKFFTVIISLRSSLLVKRKCAIRGPSKAAAQSQLLDVNVVFILSENLNVHENLLQKMQKSLVSQALPSHVANALLTFSHRLE
jgi:hypothetical protein